MNWTNWIKRIVTAAVLACTLALSAFAQAPPLQPTNAKYLGLGTGGGTANAQTITYAPPTTTYTIGQFFTWTPTNADTGATTLNVDGLGAYPIVKAGGDPLASGDIVTTISPIVEYVGSGFYLVNPQTAAGSGNATTINGAAVPASQSCLGSNSGSQLIPGTCSGSGLTTQVNGTNVINQALLNLQNSTANAEGLSATLSNGAGGNVKIEIGGANYLGNAATATLAATATALAGSPLQCTGLNFSTGINTNGNSNCATPAGGSGAVGVYDVTNGTGYFASNDTTTFTAVASAASITLTGSVGDFAPGNLAAVQGAGAPPSSSAPSGVTCTAIGKTGATTYTYAISGVSATGGYTPYTSCSITNGTTGQITSSGITSGHAGSAYAVGDPFTITGGTSNAQGIVICTSGGCLAGNTGSVTKAELLDFGAGYGTSTGNATTTTGGGTGLEYDISTVSGLSVQSYTQECWNHDTTLVAHAIWGRTGSVGSLSFLRYTRDDCFEDPGYTMSGELGAGFGTPTHPPASAVGGALEVKLGTPTGSVYPITSPSGGGITVGTSVTSATTIHDGNYAIETAEEHCGDQPSGGTVLFPYSTTESEYTMVGFIPVDQQRCTIVIAPWMVIATLGNVSFLDVDTAIDNLTVDGGSFTGAEVSVSRTGVLRFSNINNPLWLQPDGGLYLAGDEYQLDVEHFQCESNYPCLETGSLWGPEHISASQLIMHNGWWDNGTCSRMRILGANNQGWDFENQIIEGQTSASSSCPQEGYIFLGLTPTGTAVQGWTAKNVSASDLVQTIPVPYVNLQNAQLSGLVVTGGGWGNGNGDLFQHTNPGGGLAADGLLSASFTGVSLLATNGNLFVDNTCDAVIEDGNLVGNYNLFPPAGGCFSPALTNVIDGLVTLNSIPTSTYSALPPCNSNFFGLGKIGISNSNTTTWGATVTGTGSYQVEVFCDGTNWTVVGQ